MDELLEVFGEGFPLARLESVHDPEHGVLPPTLCLGMACATRFGCGDDHHSLVGWTWGPSRETDSFEALHGPSRSGWVDTEGVGEITHAPAVLLHENIERVHLAAFQGVVADSEEVLDQCAHGRATANFAPGRSDAHRKFAMGRVVEIEVAGGRHGICRVQAVEPPLHALGVVASQSVMVTPSLRHVELFTMRGLVTLLWHQVPVGVDHRPAAIVACGGAMGGLLGPAEGLYQGLGDTWAERGVPVLRVSYRRPNDMDSCCLDVAAAVQLAADAGAAQVVVMGHSFGGAVAVRVGVVMDEVCGVVTFATQSAGCEVASGLRGRPLLLFHGDADEILPLESSHVVSAMAGRGEVVVCEGDGHLLARSGRQMWDRLETWLPKAFGFA